MIVPSLGIIGNGFIGSSVAKVFQHYTSVKIYDINPEKTSHSYNEILNQDILFVCLPTPMQKDGTVNVEILRDALTKIVNNLEEKQESKPVIIKSTVPPSELQEVMLDFPELFIVFCPEFLTERTAEYDYQQTNRLIFGVFRNEIGVAPQINIIKELFNYRFPVVPQFWIPFEAASLVKYFTNMFFSTKVSLMNEFYQISKAYGMCPEEVIGLMMLDARIGRSHFQVPGHDGKFGYGGSCFIKDTHGYINIAKEVGIEPTMAKATWSKNIETRGKKVLAEELTKMLGRAASEEFSEAELEYLSDEEEHE